MHKKKKGYFGDVGVGHYEILVFEWLEVICINFKELAVLVRLRRVALFEDIEGTLL